MNLGSNALDREFEYDPLYRVVSANGRESDTQDQNDYLYSDAPILGSPNANNVRAYERQYSYDKLGNIQQLKQLGTNGFTRDFSYFSNKNTLEKIENATPSVIESFTYDNVGNQITAGTTRNYVWNAANQLITYYNQAGSNDPTIFAQYDYDGGGNRVSKLVRTGTAGSPVYERTIYIDGVFEYHILENGTTYEKNYVHVMDDTSRISMVRIGDQFPDDISDSVTYNLDDQIGSSSMRLNTSGGVVDKEEYYPFGETSFGSYAKKRYRYSGKEKDQESGLYYYGARYYMAMGCRFIGIDPHSFNYENLSPYSYVANNPILYVDPDGKDIEVGKKKAEKEKVDVPEPETKMVVRDDLDEDEIDINDPSNLKVVVTNQGEIDAAVEYNKEVEKHNAKIREHNAEIDAKIALFEDLGFSFDYNAEKGTLENAKLDEGVTLEANSTADLMYRSINDSKTYKLKTNRIPAQQITTREWGKEDGPLFTPNAFAFRGKNAGAISKKALANPNKESLQKILAADLAAFVDGADSTEVAFKLFGLDTGYNKLKVNFNRSGGQFIWSTKLKTRQIGGDTKRKLVN